ncbi:MAG: Beta-galactosidase [Firmicutes bacterium ADurb.Bin193]|nr:MAG: Beta-galactosidase [Firmicutes bacterium ADurb.Bin193]
MKKHIKVAYLMLMVFAVFACDIIFPIHTYTNRALTYSDGYVTVGISGTLIVANYDNSGMLTAVSIKEAVENDTVAVTADFGDKIMLCENLESEKPLLYSYTVGVDPKLLTPTGAAASSYQSSGELYYPPQYAIDGITHGTVSQGLQESRWTSSSQNVPESLIIDYGKICSFSSVDIWWNTAEGKTDRYSGYNIYVSDDGVSFTKVADESSNTTPYFTSLNLPETAAGQYLKIEITAQSSGWPVIFEVKAYGLDTNTAKAKAKLGQAINLYGHIEADLYTSDNMAEYQSALADARRAFAAEIIPEDAVNTASEALINAASALRLKASKEGERIVVNQNPNWIFIKEREYTSDITEITSAPPAGLKLHGWVPTDLPHTWNAQDGTDGGDNYDRTKGWYRKSMFIDSSYAGKKIYLEFGGASLVTELYVNGAHVPFSFDDPYHGGTKPEYKHKGGYDAFRFDITDYVKYGKANLIAVSVDNTKVAEVAPLSGDFTVEGGLYRNVKLVVTNPVHIDMDDYASCGLYLTPKKVTAVTDIGNTDFTLTAKAKIVNDSNSDKTVTIEAVLKKPDHYDVVDNEYIKKHLRFNPEDMYTPGGEAVAAFEPVTKTIGKGESYDYSGVVYVASPRLWDGLDDPYRYEVAFRVYSEGVMAEDMVQNVGFRYYYAPQPESFESGGGFYLNGRKYRLNGVNKHQDLGRGKDALGYAVTEKEMDWDAGIMYELGINSVRLVHYQHSKYEIELYDRLGIIVWSEIALVNNIVKNNQNSYDAFSAVTKSQLTAMIKQFYNDPSVFFWGFSNELNREVDDNLNVINDDIPSAHALFDELQNIAHSLDSTRLTTYVGNKFIQTPDLNTDVAGMNLYPYWYNTTSNAIKIAKNRFNGCKLPDGGNKAMAISEYGGSGVVGYTIEYNPDGTVDFHGTSSGYTTYQAYLHEKVYSEIINGVRFVWGSFVWQLFDSASDARQSILRGTNDKGLVMYDHRVKKDAFYFYKANWNDFEPFVHIVNAQRTQRPESTTIIRAYSNSNHCRLYLNGVPYGEPITDTNTNDGVADGFHVFMWYNVPLTTEATAIEIRGITNNREVSTSLDTTGEVVFTLAD